MKCNRDEYSDIFFIGDEELKILLVGINYRTAPVDLRECFSVAETVLAASLGRLKEQAGCQEVVLLSTCNRTEIYAIVEDASRGQEGIRRFLSSVSQLPEGDFYDHLYVREGIYEIMHMLRVVTCIDSMIVGETQILGQFKHAFLFAQAEGMTGSMINALFNRVIAFGKKVQAETSIGQNAVSVSYAAVALAKKVFDQLQNKSVLVIGAGKMSELTLTHLTAQGVKDVMIANRTIARAETVAQKFNGQALTLDQLKEALISADIIITSTGSQQLLLNAEMVGNAMRHRRMRPMFIIDIAVPRDVDPAVGKLSDVYLYDIDDLQEVVASNMSLRHQEAERVELWMEEEIMSLQAWLQEQEAFPLIAALRQKAQDIQNEVLESLYHKLPDLDEHGKKVIQKHIQSIANQILRNPTVNLKSMATEPDGANHLQTFARLFEIDYESSIDYDSLIPQKIEGVSTTKVASHLEDQEQKALSWRESRKTNPLAAW